MNVKNIVGIADEILLICYIFNSTEHHLLKGFRSCVLKTSNTSTNEKTACNNSTKDSLVSRCHIVTYSLQIGLSQQSTPHIVNTAMTKNTPETRTSKDGQRKAFTTLDVEYFLLMRTKSAS